MANFRWFTVHWPPRAHGQWSEWDFRGVWLPVRLDGQGKEIWDQTTSDIAARLEPGHLVAVYMTGSGPEWYDAGRKAWVPCVAGADGGVVAITRSLGRFRPQGGNTGRERYRWRKGSQSDEFDRYWKWHAPTEIVDDTGFVPRERVCALLHKAAGYTFRGYNDGRGTDAIHQSELERLYDEFRSTARPSWLPASRR